MVSRADARDRIIAAAVRLGTAQGAGALSLQAVADAAGVSKALLLYHYQEKDELLGVVAQSLGRDAAARIATAARANDPMVGWQALAHEECARGEVALLSALALDPAVAAAVMRETRAARTEAATRLAVRMLESVGLAPCVPVEFVGRFLIRELDGLVHATGRAGLPEGALDAESDAVVLALLAFGR